MSISPNVNQGISTGVPGSGLKVMMVDDSVVIRGLVSKWLLEKSEVGEVNTYRNGRHAIEALEKDDPDVVILDIEMPEMDGIEALQNIRKMKPDTPVIMASSLTQRNAEISLHALSLGATDCIPKPASNSGITTSRDFRRELVDKTLALGKKQKAAAAPQQITSSEAPLPRTDMPTGMPPAAPTMDDAPGPATYSLRDFSSVPPRILVIGSSTGGPIALSSILKELGSDLDKCPVLIAQHMPEQFTAILAKQLAVDTGRPCKEGVEGEEIHKGHIYVAPGGKHMVLKKEGAVTKIGLEDGPPIKFCKPAVDPLFTSVGQVYGRATLAVVLTGMGSDGRDGAQEIIENGGTIIAQDEESSVVWGMPGAVAKAGVCSAILPLEELPAKISKLMKGMTT